MPRRPFDAAADLEITLSEMLAEPIVQLLMARDGITKEDMESLFGITLNKANPNRPDGHEDGRQKIGAINRDGRTGRRRDRSWRQRR